MVKAKDGFGRGDIVRLWTHESLRVFGDRLVDDADREWFLRHLNSMVRKGGERWARGHVFRLQYVCAPHAVKGQQPWPYCSWTISPKIRFDLGFSYR